jgi:hypothetical protein
MWVLSDNLRVAYLISWHLCCSVSATLKELYYTYCRTYNYKLIKNETHMTANNPSVIRVCGHEWQVDLCVPYEKV